MTGYVLEIELATTVEEDLVDEIMEDLTDLHATIGTPPGEPANMVITLTTDADDVHEAVQVGLARAAGYGPLVGYSVIPEELRDQRAGLEGAFVDRALSVPDAADLAQVTRQTMFRWVHSGRVAATQISDRSWAVDRASVERVVSERAAQQQERAQLRRKRSAAASTVGQ